LQKQKNYTFKKQNKYEEKKTKKIAVVKYIKETPPVFFDDKK
jgi:hypothetical protein